MRVAALGRTRWLRDSIRRLHDQGHEIAGIATAPAAPEYDVRESDFERLAEELGCVCVGDLEALPRADVAISVNWPRLIPQLVLAAFTHGVLNGHPGDLPRFRGNAAPNWAILLGEERVVATVHRMDAGLDSGPIVVQRAFELDESTYIHDVYAWLDVALPELFGQAVAGLAAGTIDLTPQKGETVRCHPRLPRDGLLDWTRPAAELARLVRASAEPFAGAFTFLDDDCITVWRAHPERLAHAAFGVAGHVVDRRNSGHAAVLTGDGLLVLEEIELRGERAQAAELLTSTRLRLGLDPARLVERVRCLEERLSD